MNPALAYQLYRSEHPLWPPERLEVDRNLGEVAAGLLRATHALARGLRFAGAVRTRFARGRPDPLVSDARAFLR